MKEETSTKDGKRNIELKDDSGPTRETLEETESDSDKDLDEEKNCGPTNEKINDTLPWANGMV